MPYRQVLVYSSDKLVSLEKVKQQYAESIKNIEEEILLTILDELDKERMFYLLDGVWNAVNPNYIDQSIAAIKKEGLRN